MLFPAMKPDVDMTKGGEEHNDDDEPVEEAAQAAGDQS